jgi:hypothetical protein
VLDGKIERRGTAIDREQIERHRMNLSRVSNYRTRVRARMSGKTRAGIGRFVRCLAPQVAP